MGLNITQRSSALYYLEYQGSTRGRSSRHGIHYSNNLTVKKKRGTYMDAEVQGMNVLR